LEDFPEYRLQVKQAHALCSCMGVSDMFSVLFCCDSQEAKDTLQTKVAKKEAPQGHKGLRAYVLAFCDAQKVKNEDAFEELAETPSIVVKPSCPE
jgi:hypothetical protein